MIIMSILRLSPLHLLDKVNIVIEVDNVQRPLGSLDRRKIVSKKNLNFLDNVYESKALLTVVLDHRKALVTNHRSAAGVLINYIVTNDSVNDR